MSSPKNYSENYAAVIHVFQKNLGKYLKILKICDYLLSHPDILHIYLEEIDKAIFTYNYLWELDQKNQELYINAARLKFTDPNFTLPDTCDVFENLFRLVDKNTFITNFFSDFKKMDSTHFFENTEAMELRGTLFVGTYRTYLRVRYPWIIEKNIQIASIIEEMLALMVISGEKTELFSTIKFWIMHWKEEWFSKELARKIKYF